MEDKLVKLHTNLTADGYKLGTVEDFRAALNDSEKSKKFFENLKSDGYNLGDNYDSFANTVGVKKKGLASTAANIYDPPIEPPGSLIPSSESSGGGQEAEPLTEGLRADGTKKGKGFLGELKRPNGDVSTEISIGVPINGKETEIPTLVPTLTESEKQYLLNTPPDKIFEADPKIYKGIHEKAVAHAESRIAEGKSPFADEEESPKPKKEDLDILGRPINIGIGAPTKKPTVGIGELNALTFQRPKELLTVGEYLQTKGATPESVGLSPDYNLDKNITQYEYDAFNTRLGISEKIAKDNAPEEETSYFYGLVKNINIGTANTFRHLDTAAKALADFTGLDSSGAFGRVADYIDKNKIQDSKDVPDDIIGDVLAQVGQLEGLFLEMLVAPELGLPKLAAVLGVSGALDRYAQVRDKDMPTSGKVFETAAAFSTGATMGAIFTGIGLSGGFLKNIIANKTGSEALGYLVNMAVNSIGFTGVTAAESAIAGEEQDKRKLISSAIFGGVLTIPEAAKLVWGSSVTRAMNTTDRNIKVIDNAKIEPNKVLERLEEIDKQIESKRKEQKIRDDFDTKIIKAQEKLKLDQNPEVFIGKEADEAITKIADGEPVTNNLLKTASDQLYGEYKRLGATIESQTRKFTTKQIEDARKYLGETITKLEDMRQQQTETGEFVRKEIESVETIDELTTAKTILENTLVTNAGIQTIKENPKPVLDAIQESDITDTEKKIATDKVNSIVVETDPAVQQAKPLEKQITKLEGDIKVINDNPKWSDLAKVGKIEPIQEKINDLKKQAEEIYKPPVKVEPTKPEPEVKAEALKEEVILSEIKDDVNNSPVNEEIPGDEFRNTRKKYIPFEVVEEANKNDNITGQTAKQISQRGGYSSGELDSFLPNWRERVVELNKSKEKPTEPIIEKPIKPEPETKVEPEKVEPIKPPTDVKKEETQEPAGTPEGTETKAKEKEAVVESILEQDTDLKGNKKAQWMEVVTPDELKASREGYTVNKTRAIEDASKPRPNTKSKLSKFEQAIAFGEMTAGDAKAIIESAGIKVPKGIEDLLGKKEAVVAEINSLPLTHVEGQGMDAGAGKGTYLSTEPGNRYATDKAPAKPATVNIKNPFVIEGIDHMIEEAQRRGIKKGADTRKMRDNLIAALEKEGHDAVYFKESGSQEGELYIPDRSKVTVSQGEKVSQNFVDKPIPEIKTDEKRFQNRTELDQEQLKQIKENWNDNELDPVVIWKDKDGSTYLLAGHHRLEAAKQLGKGTIISRYFKGTEAEAIKYATEKSNANRTMEQPYDRAKIYRKMREDEKSPKEIREALEVEGKNKVYVENLSYLNPKGKIMDMLRSFGMAGDKQTIRITEQVADWIGDVRRFFPELTNAHETELYDWLVNKNALDKIRTKAEFNERVSRVADAVKMNPEEPLNLEHRQTYGTLESEKNAEINSVKREIKDLEKERDSKTNPPDENRLNEITNGIQERNKRLADLNKEIIEAREGDKAQFDIFSQINESVKKGETSDGRVKQFEKRTADEVEKFEPVVESLEGKAEDPRRISTQELNEAAKKSDEIIKEIPGEPPRPGDFLRKAKFIKGAKDIDKLQSNPLGVPMAIWDGIIELVAKAIDGGASVGKGIRIGLDNIRRSDWYKNMNKKQKDEIESTFAAYINQEYKKTTPPTPEEANAKYIKMKKAEEDAQKSFMRKAAATTKRWIPRILFDVSYNAKRHLDKGQLPQGVRAKDLFIALQNVSKGSARDVNKAKEYVFGSLMDAVKSTITTSQGIMSRAEQSLLGEYNNALRTIELDNLYDSRNQLRIRHPEDMTKEDYEILIDLWKNNTDNILKKDFGIKGDYDFSRIEEANKKFREVIDGKLKEMYENDLLTPEAYEKLKTEQVNYSPRRFLEYIDSSPTGEKSLSGIRALKEGSFGPIIKDPALLLEYAINIASRRIAKNRANKSLSEFAKVAPDNKVIKQATPSPEYFKKLKESEEKGEQPELFELGGEKKPGYVPVEWEETPKGFESIDFLAEGKPKRVFVEDWFKDEWDAVKVPEMYQTALNILSWATLTKPLKMMATGYNPAFPLTNTPLDMFHIMFTTDVYSPHLPVGLVQILKDIVVNSKSIITRTEKFDDFIKRGLYTATLTGEGGVRFKAKNYGIKSETGRFLTQAMSYPGETSEIATRIALSDRYVIKGLREFEKKGIRPTKQQVEELKDHAASMATQYLNFSDHGYLSQILDVFVPYFGAGVQVTRGTVRYARNHPLQFIYKTGQVMAFSSLIAAWNLGIFGGTEEEKKRRREKYIRDVNNRNKANYWNVMTNMSIIDSDGDDRMPYFKTPTDNTMIAFKNIAEDLMVQTFFPEERLTLLNEKRLFEVQGLLKNVGDLNSLPPALRAIRGYQDNFDDFYRQDIWKGMDFGKDKSQEYTETTPAIYKAAGKIPLPGGARLSPKRTEYVVEAVLTKNNPFYLAMETGLSVLSEYIDPELAPVKQDIQKRIIENIRQVPFANRVMNITDPNASRDKYKEIQQEENIKKEINNKKLARSVTKRDYIGAVSVIADTSNSISERERLTQRFKDLLKRTNVPSEIVNLSFLGTKSRANALYDLYLSNKYNPKKDDIKLKAIFYGGIITPDLRTTVQNGDFSDDFKKFINESK